MGLLHELCQHKRSGGSLPGSLIYHQSAQEMTGAPKPEVAPHNFGPRVPAVLRPGARQAMSRALAPAASVRPCGVRVGVWRSLVAHLLWEQRVAGSNPAAPTNHGIASPQLYKTRQQLSLCNSVAVC